MKKYVLLFIGIFILMPSCKDKNMESRLKQLTETNKTLAISAQVASPENILSKWT